MQEHVCHVFLQNCPFPQKAPKDLALLKPYPVQSCVHFVYQSWYIFILKEKNKQVTSEKESIFFLSLVVEKVWFQLNATAQAEREEESFGIIAIIL